ncbi:DUF481 domain-containing protein [Chitinophaga barathri]|uniref:DUF481 domain-containing protein n=1 Tax=Chitinophaga barathri TaxID=1647451 RepID=UPI000F4EF42E|nr:DUF481 domain-containing protein [Chitinophaga barathri]
MIGELKSIQVGIIQFKATNAGTLNIKRHNIRTMVATYHDFKVETLDGEMFYGNVFPSPVKGYIRMMGKEIKLSEIFTLFNFKEGLFRQVQGDVSAGYSFTRSSGTGRLNMDGNFTMQNRKYEVKPSFTSITSFNPNDSVSRERENITLQGIYDITPFIFPIVILTYDRNLQLGLNRRFSEGAGLGTKFLISPSMQARVITAVVMNQERYSDGTSSGNLVEIPVVLYYNFFRYTSPNISLATTQSVYFGINQDGRIREEGETKLSWEIVSDFTLSLTFYNSYDSRPSVSDNGNFDLSTVIGVGYTF